jgi:MtN3 and saliva related transmembrane protein
MPQGRMKHLQLAAGRIYNLPWPRESTSDLSLGMLATLTAGLALWVLYVASQGDWVIIAANGLGATLAATVLVCKIRDLGC